MNLHSAGFKWEMSEILLRQSNRAQDLETLKYMKLMILSLSHKANELKVRRVYQVSHDLL